MRARYPRAELAGVAHSIGTLVIGGAPNVGEFSRLVFIAAHTGYYGDYAKRHRIPMAVMWHMVMPALTRAFGYFPARMLRLGENIPAGMAMQWAARANEAYTTLRDPLTRARYLLALRGFDTGEESNTAMPADFLMQQMEWREAVAEARTAGDAARLARLREELDGERGEMLRQLGRAIDGDSNYEAGCSLVRKLRFLEKLDSEIDEALE